MKFKILTLTCITVFISGCATSFKTEMKNSPMAELTGPKFYVDTVEPSGRSINSPFSDIVKAEAITYMTSKGFQRSKTKADSHIVLYFSPGVRDRQVNVPGQTYVVPVYQPGQQTNFNAYSSNGNSVYGSAQSSGTTQYHTGYREGYTANIQDQWLELAGFVQEYGVQPKQAFAGQIYRTSNEVEFLSNENSVRSGVKQLLDKTLLASIHRAPASQSEKRPGCRMMIGFEIDQERAKDNGPVIVKRVLPTSAAEIAGMKVGDEIKTMDGYSYNDFGSNPERVASTYQRGNVKVIISRDSKDKELKVKPKETCPE